MDKKKNEQNSEDQYGQQDSSSMNGEQSQKSSKGGRAVHEDEIDELENDEERGSTFDQE